MAEVIDRSETFKRVCKSSLDLFVEKNEKYDDSITATGVLGASIELVGTVARLKKLVIRAQDAGASESEKLVDIFKDIHNYANIALMMLAEDNWRGR